MNKVYLHITPPWYALQGNGNLRQPKVPLGAAYLARAALSAGWSPYIWNGDLLPEGDENQFSPEMSAYSDYAADPLRPNSPAWADLRQALQTLRPDVVGISALTASYPSALKTAQIVKEELPECKVLMGGPHPNALPKQVLRDSENIDIVVTGEGEVALHSLLNGIVWKKFHKPIMANIVAPPLLQDLDELNWPARGRNYDPHCLLKRDHYGLVMFSRGCPYRCNFCASPELWTRKVRYRSAQDMAAEMIAIHKEYDTRYFSFQDDTFTVNKRRVMELMQAIIDTGLPTVPGFCWTCNTRPELLDAELLHEMKAAGCAAVAIGIEFGSLRMLKKVDKGFTVEQVKAAGRLIKAAGLILSGQFMCGYPTETEEEMWQTAALADELECESVMLSVATPLPATPLYQEALELGLIPAEGIDWARVTTKNDGMLMTVWDGKQYCPMPLEQRQELMAKLQAEFDRIQAKTVDKKNASRLFHEQQYLPADELGPVYGVKR